MFSNTSRTLQRPPKGLQVEKTKTQTALVRTRIPGFDYVINPYVGCAFGCRFCYVRKFLDFWGIDRPWGSFVYAKVNLPDRLRREVPRRRWPARILMSSATDPYLPQERHFRLTRRVLEILQQVPVDLQILTRSDLVLRDVDLLTRFPHLRVGFSLSTNRPEIKRRLEPRSPAIHRRIRALQALKQQGIRTYVFLAPLLPLDIESLLRDVVPYVDEILLDFMNYPGMNRRILKQAGLEFVLSPEWIWKTVEELEQRVRPYTPLRIV